MPAQVTFCSGRNTSHCRKHAQRHHPGQLADVFSCVVETERAPVERRLRFVTGWITLRLANRLLALEVPVADELPVVRGCAVGVDHHLVAVGRQRHELLEVTRCGSSTVRARRRTRCRHHEVAKASATRQRRGSSMHPRHGEQWKQQDALAAGQRSERDHRAEQRRGRQPRPSRQR